MCTYSTPPVASPCPRPSCGAGMNRASRISTRRQGEPPLSLGKPAPMEWVIDEVLFTYSRGVPYNTQENTHPPQGEVPSGFFFIQSKGGPHYGNGGFGKISSGSFHRQTHRWACALSPLSRKSARNFVRRCATLRVRL